MIELVVCDMAGTTVYDGDAVNASFRAALGVAGIAIEPGVVNEVMGMAKPEAIRILLKKTGRSDSESEVNAIHADFVARMRHYYQTDPSVREVEGASAVFRRLREAGIKVALNTGFSRSIADVLLNRLGWLSPDIVDATVTSDEVPRGRPHPDMIQHLMKRLGISDPRRIAKVGDTPVDLEEGTNVGCGLVIGVTTGSFSRESLTALPHTHIVDSIVDVPALILPA